MEIIETFVKHQKIAELRSEKVFFTTVEEAKQLMVDLYYQGFDEIVLHEKNIIHLFFDLKTGMAGEILQTFSNFKMKLTIVGDFKKYESQSLRAFISESNKGGLINFK
ncbi:MAG: DUF4180 domain-containing protein [Runella slithyformis]|nr:MAG: DUF4180 domain-containing protein [Runella slithyformis]